MNRLYKSTKCCICGSTFTPQSHNQSVKVGPVHRQCCTTCIGRMNKSPSAEIEGECRAEQVERVKQYLTRD